MFFSWPSGYVLLTVTYGQGLRRERTQIEYKSKLITFSLFHSLFCPPFSFYVTHWPTSYVRSHSYWQSNFPSQLKETFDWLYFYFPFSLQPFIQQCSPRGLVPLLSFSLALQLLRPSVSQSLASSCLWAVCQALQAHDIPVHPSFSRSSSNTDLSLATTQPSLPFTSPAWHWCTEDPLSLLLSGDSVERLCYTQKKEFLNLCLVYIKGYWKLIRSLCTHRNFNTGEKICIWLWVSLFVHLKLLVT